MKIIVLFIFLNFISSRFNKNKKINEKLISLAKELPDFLTQVVTNNFVLPTQYVTITEILINNIKWHQDFDFLIDEPENIRNKIKIKIDSCDVTIKLRYYPNIPIKLKNLIMNIYFELNNNINENFIEKVSFDLDEIELNVGYVLNSILPIINKKFIFDYLVKLEPFLKTKIKENNIKYVKEIKEFLFDDKNKKIKLNNLVLPLINFPLSYSNKIISIDGDWLTTQTKTFNSKDKKNDL